MILNPELITERLPADVTVDGIYVLKCPDPNDATNQGCIIPIACLNGKLYGMAITHELPVEGFRSDVKLFGPIK